MQQQVDFSEQIKHLKTVCNSLIELVAEISNHTFDDTGLPARSEVGAADIQSYTTFDHSSQKAHARKPKMMQTVTGSMHRRMGNRSSRQGGFTTHRAD